jgi:hypothetical protein
MYSEYIDSVTIILQFLTNILGRIRKYREVRNDYLHLLWLNWLGNKGYE